MQVDYESGEQKSVGAYPHSKWHLYAWDRSSATKAIEVWKHVCVNTKKIIEWLKLTSGFYPKFRHFLPRSLT